MKKTIKVIKFILMAITLVEIIHFIGIGVELGLDITYNVSCFTTDDLEMYYKDVKFHTLFLILLLTYLISEYIISLRDNR